MQVLDLISVSVGFLAPGNCLGVLLSLISTYAGISTLTMTYYAVTYFLIINYFISLLLVYLIWTLTLQLVRPNPNATLQKHCETPRDKFYQKHSYICVYWLRCILNLAATKLLNTFMLRFEYLFFMIRSLQVAFRIYFPICYISWQDIRNTISSMQWCHSNQIIW
jgi:hypothetical protein